MPTIMIPLAEGFEEIEAVALIDVLRRGELEVAVLGVGGQRVKGAHGIEIVCDGVISGADDDSWDMILLPGGWGGTRNLSRDPDVMRIIQTMDAQGKTVGAMCAAPYVLRKAGVLRGEFTCYPGAKEEIGTDGYTDREKVIISGNIMTSQGPGTAICFGLAIVEKLRGEAVANGLRKGMLAEYCR